MANFGNEELLEVRRRMLAVAAGEVLFRLEDSTEAFAQRLGVARLLVFDAGSSVAFAVGQASLKAEGAELLRQQATMVAEYTPGLPHVHCGHKEQPVS